MNYFSSESTMKKALVIDDDDVICCTAENTLSSMGFFVESQRNGLEGLKEALEGNYSLLLIDVMLPNISGFQLLKQLRTQSDVPVIMITSRHEEENRVQGFELGADDFIGKPFSQRELIARVKSVMRRSNHIPRIEKVLISEETTLDGGLTLYRDYPRISCNGKVYELSNIEYRILKFLVAKAGQEIPKKELAKVAVGQEESKNEHVIEMYLYLLRKKIGDNVKTPRFIKVIGDNAYMFAPAKRAISLEIMP